MKNNFEIHTQKMAELFCGPGGLALGAIKAKLEQNGATYSIEPVWANDVDPNACKTYANNIHRGDCSKIICSPVENVDLSSIPRFNGLAFGFPCNDFSVVGEQKGTNGKFGPLYSFGVSCLEMHNPEWFLAENVSGLRSSNNGNAFKTILESLRYAGKHGYKLTAHLYKFEEYGVPQQRHRVIIVGIRRDLNKKFLVPKPLVLNESEYASAKEAIEIPPIGKNVSNNEKTNQSKQVIERLKHIKPGQNAWNSDMPSNLQLNVKGAKLSQIYRRLLPNRPAYTVTGSGGGGTYIYHWKENRALTNRERARLQTFPDDYIFYGGMGSVRKQIGMAVPPEGSKFIFRALLMTLAGIEYESVKSNLEE